MMTIIPSRDNANDRGNEVKGDVINNDVIMTMPTSLMTFYDYKNDSDNDNDFMIVIMLIIRTVVRKEIIEHCDIHTFFNTLYRNYGTCEILNKGKL